jgi:hypothetical protein
MRTDRWALSALFVSSLSLSALLSTGCPGTLDDKQRFLVEAGSAGGPDGGTGGEDADADVEAGTDAGAEAGAAPAAGPCGDVVTRIFVPSCGGTGCHGAVGAQQDLDLVSEGVAARVVGVPGVGCASLLADPANPEASLIYQKLSPTPACGSPMPLSRPALSDEDVACVLTWIAAQ